MPTKFLIIHLSLLVLAITACASEQSAQPIGMKPREMQPREMQPREMQPQTPQAQAEAPSLQPQTPSAENRPLGFQPRSLQPRTLQPVQLQRRTLKPLKLQEITLSTVKVEANDQATVITLPADILFDFDKDVIRADAEQALQQISQVIANRYPSNNLQINGHTDAKGEDNYNQDLSERRAVSVQQWLMQNAQVASDRLITQGYGETDPVAPNENPDGSDNPDGRQQNRRVEVVILNEE